MKCSDIMIHDVRTVKVTDDAFFAARLMREHQIGFLPVEDGKGRVVGVVTDRDLAMKVTGGDRAAVDTLVGNVMSSPVICCRAGAAVADAERAMTSHAMRRLVVIDGRGHAVGVISRTDLRRESPGAAAVTTRGPGKESSGTPRAHKASASRSARGLTGQAHKKMGERDENREAN